MLGRLAAFLVRRRRRVLLGAVAAFLVAGAFGSDVASHLSQGGFEDPHAPSKRAEDVLEHVFGQGEPNLVLLVTAKDPGATVDAPGVASVGRFVTEDLAKQPGIAQAVSYWSLGSPPPLKSKDSRQALVLARIAGDQDEVADRVKVLGPRLERDGFGVTVRVGGFAQVFREVGDQIESDLAKAELLAFPITLVLLIIVFGSVVAATLPLAIGVLAIVGAMLSLKVVAGLTEVSIFSLNLVTAMGLGLAIDYSLFLVSRFREELRHGRDTTDAVIVTVRTAGRTVLFSALTVAVSLSALLIFPLAFLRSFAYAGIAVVVLAAIGAIVVLPALLAALGPKVDRLRLFHRRPKEVGEGVWHRIALGVMRRPIGIGTAAIVLLLLLGVPFLRIAFSLPDDRVLPTSAGSRQVQDELRANFSSEEVYAVSSVLRGLDPFTHAPEIDAYASRLSRLDNVARVDAATGTYVDGAKLTGPLPISTRFVAKSDTWVSVVPSVEPLSKQGEQLVDDVRATPSPVRAIVGGAPAQLVDEKASLFGKMPLAVGIIALSTFVLLFLSFGSVLVPIKALVLNVLSLSATFGAMVWIFQDGHLSGFFSFTPTGALDTTTPILMFCIAFGLSMDYEVFLLSRIKEEHDRTGDNVRSVAVGLEHTGRIVTAAAALLAIIFLAFATSKITFIKLFGVGLTMAVVMDATVIRAALVPAFMRLAGAANWWAPRPLRRFHERFGINEHVDLEPIPIDREPALVDA